MVQRDRIAGVDAMIGERIPREAQTAAREAHCENGSICREDGVLALRAVNGSSKSKGPNRFVCASSNGMMSAQAIYKEGLGINGG